MLSSNVTIGAVLEIFEPADHLLTPFRSANRLTPWCASRRRIQPWAGLRSNVAGGSRSYSAIRRRAARAPWSRCQAIDIKPKERGIEIEKAISTLAGDTGRVPREAAFRGGLRRWDFDRRWHCDRLTVKPKWR